MAKVLGKDNPADLMTKGVDQAELDKHTEPIGVRYPQERAAGASRIVTDEVPDFADVEQAPACCRVGRREFQRNSEAGHLRSSHVQGRDTDLILKALVNWSNFFSISLATDACLCWRSFNLDTRLLTRRVLIL